MDMIEIKNIRPKVTAIMAAYNTEAYVRRAVESVQKQTMEEWELWCVDDASTDTTAAILDEMAAVDSRIKVMHLEKNVGLGKARNSVMDKVQGKYMCFIDSDDYIKEDYMNTLYALAEKTGSEEIYFGMQHEWEETFHKDTVNNIYFGEETEYTIYEGGIKFLLDMIKHNLLSYAGCRQFFLTDFVMRSNVRFEEDIISEDVPFTVNAMLACQKLCYLRKEMYVYCHRWGSLTQNRLTWKNLYSAFKIFMEFFNIWLDSANDAQRREAMVYLYRHLLAYCKNIYMRLSSEEIYKARDRISVNSHADELFGLLVEENLKGYFIQGIAPEKLERIQSYSKIIVYGAGNYAVDLYLLLKRQYINVLGFAVTECSKNVSSIDGKSVLSAEEWIQDKDDALVLLGCSVSLKEGIIRHLDKLGFCNVMSV